MRIEHGNPLYDGIVAEIRKQLGGSEVTYRDKRYRTYHDNGGVFFIEIAMPNFNENYFGNPVYTTK